ncbi:type III restriction-modification system endonuclease [Streptomyces halstedii]|uniref:type III restriction-modification system endonuclease n=1 Tax=Streptomyces halstedii TaxID=1944 RepID=UPI0037AF6C97
MKLHFSAELEHQRQAWEAVCGLFRGQETCRSEFTVSTAAAVDTLFVAESDLGIGNRLALLPDELLKNLRAVQLENQLPQSTAVDPHDLNFTVEMETGTGKTYVYLRTIYELHRRYGFTKFVIVVPSVAIKEGVYKSLQIMEEHFKNLYDGTHVNYFLYDSTRLGDVRNYATSADVQVMIATVGAINKKDTARIYKDSEQIGGERPIDLIRATNPILIVDEPQSVDGGLQGAGKQALAEMNPLCTLRYSATHVDKHHMVHRLDAIDAFEQKLVKQIEIAGGTVEGAHSRPYVRLLSVKSPRNVFSAQIEVDALTPGGIRRVKKTVQPNDLLRDITERDIYEGLQVGEIRTATGSKFMQLHGGGVNKYLKEGETHGDVDPREMVRQLINRTIREHLNKELVLRPKGLKVLSLFFIDKVDHYRQYDAQGNPVKGDYALIFEEEYRRLTAHPDYQTLFEGVDLRSTAEQVHNGYFSVDKKGVWKDTSERGRDGSDAESAYNLIMKEKERLLSLDEPLKFLFSHSALREGWDNPNVFQICSLREMRTERQRRQTIGRGLRLAVNQSGERVQGFDVNTLTVVATESFEQFAAELQSEIEQETDIRFGRVEPHLFAGIAVPAPDGSLSSLGSEQSQSIYDHLLAQGYLSPAGKIQDALRVALAEETFELPPEFAALTAQVAELLHKRAGGLPIKNADKKKTVKTRKAVLDSPEFKELWERIKYRTTYRVSFSTERLIEDCAEALKEAPPIPPARLQWVKAKLVISDVGITATEASASAPIVLNDTGIPLPDILSELHNRTQLTRRTIQRILVESGRLADFRRNPQQFIDEAATAINHCKQQLLVKGVKYERTSDGAYYAQERFELKELMGYLDKNLRENTLKSVYEDVVYDSENERRFIDRLEEPHNDVKVYAKLPAWFKVPTPLGSYNPDWAIVRNSSEGERLYFVIETKSTQQAGLLRPTEEGKTKCGAKHFKALESGVSYLVVDDFDQVFG